MEDRYGTYCYDNYNYNTGRLDSYKVTVKIVGETEKSYKIQLLGFTHNRVPNQTLWVSKRKIQVKGEEKKNQSFNENETYWWQDM